MIDGNVIIDHQPFKTFRNHQQVGKLLLDGNDSLFVAWEMGTGKTMLMLWWIRDALRTGRIKDALVVCPASLVRSWEKAIEEDVPQFKGFTYDDVRLLKECVTIKSYQGIYHSEKVEKGTYYGRKVYRKVIKLRPDVDKVWGAVICDEAHALGGHASIQTKACITLSRLAKYRFALSATPVHGGGGQPDYSKLYGEVQFLHRGERWTNWTEFCNNAVEIFDRWHKPAAYNDRYCKQLMEDDYIVCRLEDCFDMPGISDQTVECPLSEVKVYKDLKSGRIEDYNITVENNGTIWLKLLQLCSGAFKTDNGNVAKFTSSKLDVLQDLAAGTDQPMVVFCQYRASVDACYEVCMKAKRKTLIFDGRVTDKSKWEEFSKGKYDVIVTQYNVGGAGLNLQRAHISIFFEPCLSALLLEQASGRTYRPGQTEHCIRYYLTTPKSIEDAVWKKVRSGAELSADALADLGYNEDRI